MKQLIFLGVITSLIFSLVPVGTAQEASRRPEITLPDLSNAPGLPPGVAERFSHNRFEKMWPDLATRPSFKSQTEAVNCNAGESIQTVLDTIVADELKIDITGTCNETVNVRRHSVALRGVGNPTITGGLDIRDSRGVTVSDLSVVDGSGISIDLGSAVELYNVSSTGSSGHGIFLGDSAVYAEGIVSTNNAVMGIRVDTGTEFTFSGDMDLSDNGGWGLFTTTQSHVLAFNFNLTANNNPGAGIGMQFSSSLLLLDGTITAENNGLAGFFSQLSSISAFAGNTIHVSNNGAGGMIAVSQSAVIEGPNTIVATGNGLAGIALEESSLWTTFGGTGSVMNLSNNEQFGIRAKDGCVMYMRGPDNNMTITGNPTAGIALINATGRFEGLRAFRNNDADMVLSFGGRAAFLERTQVDDILCQGGGLVAEGDGEPFVCESGDEFVRLKLRSIRSLLDAPLSAFKTAGGASQ